MKKFLLALFALSLTACSMTETQPHDTGNCIETGLGLDCGGGH